jgi:hypothetical protein
MEKGFFLQGRGIVRKNGTYKTEGDWNRAVSVWGHAGVVLLLFSVVDITLSHS